MAGCSGVSSSGYMIRPVMEATGYPRTFRQLRGFSLLVSGEKIASVVTEVLLRALIFFVCILF